MSIEKIFRFHRANGKESVDFVACDHKLKIVVHQIDDYSDIAEEIEVSPLEAFALHNFIVSATDDMLEEGEP